MPTDEKEKKFLDETSPSVQAHLEIIQNVIERMASNSSQCKAWCIALVSALLVIVADKGKPNFVWITMFPSFLFLVLDAYYLALEKAFRESYNTFVKKIHNNLLMPEDLYALAPAGEMYKHRIEALKSFSVWGFYIGVVILIGITRYIVLP